MARARGANAVLSLAFNAGAYGAVPNNGFVKLPFVTAELGDEQGLVESDVLGNGRDPQAPSQDVIKNEGNVVVPVDLRAFGHWLRLLMGDPATAQGKSATGTFAFGGQPANNATITVNGTAFTFKNSPSADTDIKIGATLAETIQNAVVALNASADANVKVASYATDLNLASIQVTYDALGTGGNAFTLAASSSPDSHATPSGATLAGGSASGLYRHTFTAGAIALPDAAAEIGNPDVPSFAMNYGVMANTLALTLQRSGHLNATIGLIAQGEKPRTTVTASDATDDILLERFSQFTGAVARDGVPLSEVVSANLNFSNGLDKVESIREDGRIGGIDPGLVSATGNVAIRFRDTVMMDLATNGTPVEIRFGWKLGAKGRLTFIYHQTYLPKPKVPITGPGGVQAQFAFQGAEHPTLHKTLTVILENDVDAYA